MAEIDNNIPVVAHQRHLMMTSDDWLKRSSIGALEDDVFYSRGSDSVKSTSVLDELTIPNDKATPLSRRLRGFLSETFSTEERLDPR